MDLWEVLKASKGVPITSDMYDALFGKALGGAGSVWETENAPYLFRRSGGSLRTRLLGKEKDTIVGASVAWNQLVNIQSHADESGLQGLTVAYSTGKIHISGTATGTDYIQPQYVDGDIRSKLTVGHRHLIVTDYFNSATDCAFMVLANPYTDTAYTGVTISGKRYTFYTPTSSDGYAYFRFRTIENQVYNKDVHYQIFDLTLMFGSAIADYAYTLETQQAGKGVAWLKSYGFFGQSYFPFCQGEIKSVSGLSAHKMVGKNLLDDSAKTTTIQNIYYYRNNGYLLKKGVAYTLSVSQDNTKPAGLYVHDMNSGNLKVAYNTYSTTYTPTEDIYANFDIYFSPAPTEGTANVKVMLEMNNTATDFKPYHSDTYALDSDLVLRGRFVLDANNNLKAVGDVYPPSGEIARNYTEADLGSKNWTRVSVDGNFYVFYSEFADKAIGYDFISDAYVNAETSKNNLLDKQMGCYTNSGGQNRYITIRDDSFTDEGAFKTAMSGKKIVYAVATPTTETATPFASPQKVDKDGTEEYITTDSFVPVGHETQYKCSPTP